MIGGLVLAAGASRRMGRPKALLEFDGVPAIHRTCRALREGGCTRVLVVLGSDASVVEPAVPSGVEVVEHEAWSRGRTSSVKAGLEVLQRADHVVIAPVDRPLFEPADVAALLASPKPIAVPTYDGHRGHPLRIAHDVVAEILALADDAPLHEVLHRDNGRVAEIPVRNPGVLSDLNTPADYEAAKKTPRRWKPAPDA